MEKRSKEFINKCFNKALIQVEKEFKYQVLDIEKKINDKIKSKKIEKAFEILYSIDDNRKLSILVKKFARKKNNQVYLEILKNLLTKKYNIENNVYIEKINFDFIEHIFDEFGINIFSLKKGIMYTNKYDYLLKTKNTKNNYLNYLISEDFEREFLKYKSHNIVLKLFNKNNNSEQFNRFLKENKDLNINEAILKELKLFNYEELLSNKELLINTKIKTELILNLIEEKKQENIEKYEREHLINNKINENFIITI